MYKSCEISIFALESSKEFGEKVCNSLGYALKRCEEKIFPDGESYVRPLENVRGKDVFVIQSLDGEGNESVDTKLMKLALFNNAACYGSAARITDVIPYMAYVKQDRKDKSRAPLSSKVVANLLMGGGTKNGANRILSIDWHSPAVQNAYEIPVDILEPYKEFITFFLDLIKNEEKIVVLAPDLGALKSRVETFSDRLSQFSGKKVFVAVTDKTRDGNEVSSRYLMGDVKDAFVIICDDEAATGSSLINAAKKAQDKGAKRIWAWVTHGKFIDDAVSKINNSPIEGIVTSDTIYKPDSFFEANSKIKKVSVAPLFGEAIRRIHNSESISSLFT